MKNEKAPDSKAKVCNCTTAVSFHQDVLGLDVSERILVIQYWKICMNNLFPLFSAQFSFGHKIMLSPVRNGRLPFCAKDLSVKVGKTLDFQMLSLSSLLFSLWRWERPLNSKCFNRMSNIQFGIFQYFYGFAKNIFTCAAVRASFTADSWSSTLAWNHFF